MAKRSIRDLDVNNRTVLVRVDFNVPTEEKDGAVRITDDTRIQETLPTIQHLRDAGAKVVLLAHFGRPKGKPVEKYSLRPVAARLGELLGAPVEFCPKCAGPEAQTAVQALEPGQVLLLENVRFHAEEEQNDEAFSKALALLGDVYVNDAFGAAHRAHASTAGVASQIGKSAMGFLMEKELKYLQDELADPAHPFLVILGGSKVSDKIGVIKALMRKADTFLIGGAMTYTFFKALGIPVGNSRVENDKLDLAKEILELARAKGVKFMLPVDNLETQEIRPGAAARNTGKIEPGHGITDGWEAVDIGAETLKLYQAEIARAKTILWNGPVGIFEIPDFAKGTTGLAQALAANKEATTIIGGGDSVTAVKQAGLAGEMTFISTGGGASLELLEGKTLPGVAALSEQ